MTLFRSLSLKSFCFVVICVTDSSAFLQGAEQFETENSVKQQIENQIRYVDALLNLTQFRRESITELNRKGFAKAFEIQDVEEKHQHLLTQKSLLQQKLTSSVFQEIAKEPDSAIIEKDLLLTPQLFLRVQLPGLSDFKKFHGLAHFDLPWEDNQKVHPKNEPLVLSQTHLHNKLNHHIQYCQEMLKRLRKIEDSAGTFRYEIHLYELHLEKLKTEKETISPQIIAYTRFLTPKQSQSFRFVSTPDTTLASSATPHSSEEILEESLRRIKLASKTLSERKEEVAFRVRRVEQLKSLCTEHPSFHEELKREQLLHSLADAEVNHAQHVLACRKQEHLYISHRMKHQGTDLSTGLNSKSQIVLNQMLSLHANQSARKNCTGKRSLTSNGDWMPSRTCMRLAMPHGKNSNSQHWHGWMQNMIYRE